MRVGVISMEESYEEWNRAVIAWYEESEMVRKMSETLVLGKPDKYYLSIVEVIEDLFGYIGVIATNKILHSYEFDDIKSNPLQDFTGFGAKIWSGL